MTYFYIGIYGHIMEHAGVVSAKEPPMETSFLYFENKFYTRERATMFRDKLREQKPRVFIKKERQRLINRMKTEPISQDEFRAHMRRGVAEHIDEFWKKLSALSPKDYCDGFLKAAAFGFSRAPAEKDITEEDRRRQQEQEEQRKQELILRGISLDE